jgi:hypothetical protein
MEMATLCNNIFRQATLFSSTTRWMEGLAPSYDLYRMYSAKDTVRRKATIMLTGDFYPELNQAGGGYKADQVRPEKTHYWQRKR